MSYDEGIYKRVADSLSGVKGISEMKMFGGICFLLNGNMVCGVNGERILLRVNPSEGEELAKKDGVEPMIHGGRSIKGFLQLSPRSFSSDKNLQNWMDITLDFVSKLPAKKKK